MDPKDTAAQQEAADKAVEEGRYSEADKLMFIACITLINKMGDGLMKLLGVEEKHAEVRVEAARHELEVAKQKSVIDLETAKLELDDMRSKVKVNIATREAEAKEAADDRVRRADERARATHRDKATAKHDV